MRSRTPALSFVGGIRASTARFTIAAGLSTAALSGAAGAQSPGVLGKDDAAFARELYKSGFTDLAEGLCKTIEGAGKLSPEAEVGVKSLHLDLRFDLARRETDMLKRKDLIKAVLDAKEDFVHQYGNTKEAGETSETLPDVYRALGETISAAIQKTSDVKEVSQLVREGEQAYTQAEDKIKARIEELAQDHASPANDRLYCSMRYNLPRTFYYHSLLFPAGEWKKKDLLEKAVEGFQEFGLDYQDNLLYYDGQILQGLASKDLGKPEDALAAFDEAIGLAALFPVDSKGVFAVSPEAADTISTAVLQKVLFQKEQKDYAGAIATAKKYFATIPDAARTRNGLATLAAQAETEIASGDAKSAGDSAQKLVDLDPKGPWGEKGRELQGKLLTGGGGELDATAMLKVAANFANRGDETRAIQVAHQAIGAAHGTPKEANIGCEAYLLIGTLYLQRGPGWTMEAALAFDTAAETWPKAEKAAQAVSQSMSAYLRLNSEDKRTWFKKRADDRQKTLSTQYTNDPLAARANLAGAQTLEGEGKFLEAAAEYQKLQPGSPIYLEAQFRAGSCYFQHARKLCLDKKEGEAAQFVKQAETLVKKARADFDEAQKGTMDLEAQARLKNSGFQARVTLAQLYLLDCVNRPADVIEALKDVDEAYSNDEDKLATAWGLRISALEKQGKLDEAIALLDSLMKKNPDSRAIGGAAGQIARAIDRRAQELLTAGKTKESDDQLKRAAVYYSMSGRALSKSTTTRAAVIEEIANRLFAIGLHFNNVPTTWDSFVGWQASQTKEPNMWREAEALYRAALQLAPSYQDTIHLGRSSGFLGQYADAAAEYGRLFDSESIIEAGSVPPKFNWSLIKQKPDLYLAYLEWGVAAQLTAEKTQDAEMYLRAGTIFDNLVRTPPRDANGAEAKIYWHSKLHQIQNLMAQGKYKDAGLLMRDIERNNDKLGAAAGLEADFKKLKEEVSKKDMDQSPRQTPSSPGSPKEGAAKGGGK
jgi:tetratricopeptide (TPR) repeat protein